MWKPAADEPGSSILYSWRGAPSAFKTPSNAAPTGAAPPLFRHLPVREEVGSGSGSTRVRVCDTPRREPGPRDSGQQMPSPREEVPRDASAGNSVTWEPDRRRRHPAPPESARERL